MKTRDFSFSYPEHLVAQNPPAERGTCRLMRVDRSHGGVSHHHMPDIVSLLPPDATLVLNDSKVRKARLIAESETGGIVEFLLVEQKDERSWNAVVSRAKRQRPGRRYQFPGSVSAMVTGIDGQYRTVEFSHPIDDEYLERYGHIPLPPYIRREDTPDDAARYQTVYSRNVGSVAAPTAGLHFTDEILERIESAGIRIARVTLHVGIGTFLPIRTDAIEDHTMHRESYEISPDAAVSIQEAIDERRPVIAVGTTSVRTLESAATIGDGKPVIHPGRATTELYIYPGYEFKVVSGMFTNFHTPESSLFVMVSAFAGTGLIRSAYAAAIEEQYRLFSYGDAMLII